jgi:hypothetical protein
MLSMTRVIEVKKYDASSEDSKDFVYFGDKLLNFIERFNNFLVKLLGKILKYLGKKFTGPFRNKDR